MKYKILFLLSVSGAILIPSIYGQSVKTHPGVQFFNNGLYEKAIKSLVASRKTSEFKENSEIWNYLGLSYMQMSEPKKARQAFQKAVELNPTNSVYRTNLAYCFLLNRQREKAFRETDKAIELDGKNITAYQIRGYAHLWGSRIDAAESDARKMIEFDPTSSRGYGLQADIYMTRLGERVKSGATIKEEIDLLHKTVSVLETAVAFEKGESKVISDKLVASRAFVKYFTRDQTKPPPPASTPLGANVRPFRIFKKPPAQYTTEARFAGTQGSIRIVAILGPDEEIKHYLLLNRLGHGLDEAAVTALRSIRFQPKMVDGKPEPVVITIEYNFNLY